MIAEGQGSTKTTRNSFSESQFDDGIHGKVLRTLPYKGMSQTDVGRQFVLPHKNCQKRCDVY